MFVLVALCHYFFFDTVNAVKVQALTHKVPR